MEQRIDEILKTITGRNLFPSVTRFQYLPYNMKVSLKVVEAIGKSRNPRFVIDDDNRFTYENLIRWVHGDDEMECVDLNTKNTVPAKLNAGIYIAGNTGTGKSWALEIISAYCLIDNVQVKVGENRRCLQWENIRTDVICDEYTASGSVDRYKKLNVAGFQDLGAEPAESLYMGNRINVMRQILEHRGDRTDQLTMITSNMRPNHDLFITRYGDRVSSRMYEMCNYFEIKGRDRRK